VATKKQRSTKRSSSLAERRQRGLVVFVVRILSWVAICVLVLALLAGIVVGLKSVFFTSNPHFVLQNIAVNATGRLRQKEVVALLRDGHVIPGESNIFNLDLQEIREQLELNVMIDQATVARRLPSTLLISVYERQPVACLRCRPQRLLDDEGCILPPRQGERLLPLPEITGVKGTRSLRVGRRITDDLVLASLRFIHLVATRPDGRFYDIETIQLDYSAPALIVFLRPRGTFRNGARVILPTQGITEAMDRLMVIINKRTRARQSTSFINATYEINVPVKK
jgi:cell division septal protein FtsQ